MDVLTWLRFEAYRQAADILVDFGLVFVILGFFGTVFLLWLIAKSLGSVVR